MNFSLFTFSIQSLWFETKQIVYSKREPWEQRIHTLRVHFYDFLPTIAIIYSFYTTGTMVYLHWLCTIIRCLLTKNYSDDGRTKPEPRESKKGSTSRKRAASEHHHEVDEHQCLIRAAKGNKKISTVVRLRLLCCGR